MTLKITSDNIQPSDKINNLGSGSGARVIDLALGNYVTATATGACQWTVNSYPGVGYLAWFILELKNGGTGTQTWMTNIKWPSAQAPGFQIDGTDVLVFINDDNGPTWRGMVSMYDSR